MTFSCRLNVNELPCGGRAGEAKLDQQPLIGPGWDTPSDLDKNVYLSVRAGIAKIDRLQGSALQYENRAAKVAWKTLTIIFL